MIIFPVMPAQAGIQKIKARPQAAHPGSPLFKRC
jgi:hypothetical protein